IFFTRSPISLIAATSCPSNWARLVGAPEPLRYGLAWYPASDHRVASGPLVTIGTVMPPQQNRRSGYHTSNPLTSTAASHLEPVRRRDDIQLTAIPPSTCSVWPVM